MTKHILLVEYDESTIHFIKDILPAPLFEVDVALDGETAKRKLSGRNYDMMITAAMLPRFHGFNLALTVAQENPLIKIIIISAIYKGFYYKHQATSQYRADDFFEKPLEKESFRSRVLELLNVSANDLIPAANAAATHVPAFDTAKVPTLAKLEQEENKLSADDIFGDLIKSIDRLPEYKIELNPDPAPKNVKMDGTVLPSPAPAQTVQMKREPEPTANGEKPAPLKIEIPAAAAVSESRKPAAAGQNIDYNLDSLRQTVKKQVPETKMRKIEDDIARRFEDTLSGLGLGVQPPKPAPKPAAAEPKTTDKPLEKTVGQPVEKAMERPPVITIEKMAAPVEENVITFDADKPADEEIIELGEESLQPDKQPEAKAAVAPAAEARVEKKAPPVENPNELGDYVLLGLIARGGMAEIYKAKRKGVKGFEKVIAIKKILSGYGEDDKYIEMLVDEAKIAAELSHPNIIQIYDLGRKDNYYFIAMEFVQGKDLREIQGRLREKDQWFPEEISLFLTLKILEALNYAHKAKDSHGHALEIVHRDVSPPNILISYGGEVKLTDFGISKASIKMHHTISGALKGKLLYMSPEQARAEGTIDCRSDLYSVGVVLFELLTGKKLFLDTSEMGVLKKVQNGEILNPREINPAIDPALEKIILKSLHKDCEKRYQSAAAMIADLETFMVKKYNYLPGPVQLSHFIFRLFEKDIVRDGIKVDLKPLPEKPLLREIVKAQAETQEAPSVSKPPPAAETKPPEPPPPPPLTAPTPESAEKRDEVVHIDFDEDKILPAKKGAAAADAESRKAAPLFMDVHEEKKKKPFWPVAILLVAMAAAALVYFLVLKKPDLAARPAEAQPAVEENKPAVTPVAETQPAIEDQQALLAAKLKQEEELRRQLQEATAAAEAEKLKKLQDEKRARQVEAERLKKEEAERLKQEEIERLQKEEALKKQEEIDRLAREAQELKKAQELKDLESKRVREGDIVSIGQVDTEPQVISKSDPVIPANIRGSLTGDQAVLFNILINHNGDVESARLMRKTTNGQLDNILIATIKTWKYAPAKKDGVRVKVWKTFQLLIKK